MRWRDQADIIAPHKASDCGETPLNLDAHELEIAKTELVVSFWHVPMVVNVRTSMSKSRRVSIGTENRAQGRDQHMIKFI